MARGESRLFQAGELVDAEGGWAMRWGSLLSAKCVCEPRDGWIPGSFGYSGFLSPASSFTKKAWQMSSPAPRTNELSAILKVGQGQPLI